MEHGRKMFILTDLTHVSRHQHLLGDSLGSIQSIPWRRLLGLDPF